MTSHLRLCPFHCPSPAWIPWSRVHCSHTVSHSYHRHHGPKHGQLVAENARMVDEEGLTSNCDPLVHLPNSLPR